MISDIHIFYQKINSPLILSIQSSRKLTCKINEMDDFMKILTKNNLKFNIETLAQLKQI